MKPQAKIIKEENGVSITKMIPVNGRVWYRVRLEDKFYSDTHLLMLAEQKFQDYLNEI